MTAPGRENPDGECEQWANHACTCETECADDRPAAPVPATTGDVEGLARWYVEFDGPAYPTGEEFAEAFLASGWLAKVRADAASAAWDEGAQFARHIVPNWLLDRNPYRARAGRVET